MDLQRRETLAERPLTGGPVVYWMSRDQRVNDNWALLHAQELALANHTPLAVIFAHPPASPGATLRHDDFMLRGLEQVEVELTRYRIPFSFLIGSPEKEVVKFMNGHGAGALVTDFSPLRNDRTLKMKVGKALTIPFYEVDTHNIVPCRVVSHKREFAAATLRPKMHRLLPAFLTDFPCVVKHPFAWKGKHQHTDWKHVRQILVNDTRVLPVENAIPGAKAASETLQLFIEQKLRAYDGKRNDPTQPVQSDLSPYLHFGQIAPQRVALEITRQSSDGAAKEAFLEELIVRRELSDNFCQHTPCYDTFEGFPSWAKATLDIHRSDRRIHTYTRRQFELARTHDPLWNSAQTEMVSTGKMHGYMRMYWAKKILEWTATPEEAMAIAIDLNDKYELDGRDPNGYVGIAWSIGGVHDRAWGERRVFGKIRYMNANGCKRKFDVNAYIAMQKSRSEKSVDEDS